MTNNVKLLSIKIIYIVDLNFINKYLNVTNYRTILTHFYLEAHFTLRRLFLIPKLAENDINFRENR